MPTFVQRLFAYWNNLYCFRLDGNLAVCCDWEQFTVLQHQLSVPKQIMSRCPSCFSNFANFWCQFACSPRQKHFVKVLKTDSTKSVGGESYITDVVYNVEDKYAEGMYNACKNVRRTIEHSNNSIIFIQVTSSIGGHVFGTMCGTSVENCTPERWFLFLGTYNKKLNIPFNIHVNVTGDGTNKTMREHIYGCNESSDISSTKCDCANCLESCDREEPYPNLDMVGLDN